MPGFKVDTKLTSKGPMFQNPTDKIKKFMDAAEEEMARVGKNMVVAKLGQVLQNPTGYYESRIQTDRSSSGWEVNDGRRVVYGPWLEGTGSRNKTTRFKGYRTFRLIKQELDQRRQEILRPVINRFLNEMK
jgi:hypothetical protein